MKKLLFSIFKKLATHFLKLAERFKPEPTTKELVQTLQMFSEKLDQQEREIDEKFEKIAELLEQYDQTNQ